MQTGFIWLSMLSSSKML